MDETNKRHTFGTLHKQSIFPLLKYSIETILLSAGGEVQEGQYDEWKRFAVIDYDDSLTQFVFSARRWNDLVLSYICQLQQGLSVRQVHSTKVCSLPFY